MLTCPGNSTIAPIPELYSIIAVPKPLISDIGSKKYRTLILFNLYW